ncbi:MAG: VanZ family protein [Lachnospiraceae bacterium]|nr:VanZ family protein [Lachnospiraceae bacterium]
MKKYLFDFLLIILVIITVLSIREFGEPKAIDLSTRETKEGNTVRIDYIDDSGNVTVASDRKYATAVRTFGEHGLVREEYYDVKGAPTESIWGYAAIERSYNDKGLADTDTYYDIKGNRAKHTGGYYGYSRIYDDNNRAAEVNYLDEKGGLVCNSSDFAIAKREFDDKGLIRREFYYDVSGAPAVLPLGQSGTEREYNADKLVSKYTYLDRNGNPMRTNLGYVSVENQYDEKKRLISVRYLDENGAPTMGKYKQYGEKYVDGQAVYLDREGKPIFRLDNLLGSNPRVVLIVAVIILVAALFLKGRLRTALTVFYFLFILYMTLWHRETGDARGEFVLFWSYRKFFFDPSMRQSIINNIWLFVPFGALLYKKGSKRFIIPILLSVAIESIQYFTGVGLCELDDVFSNGLGGLIGYGVVSCFKPYFKEDRGMEETADHI